MRAHLLVLSGVALLLLAPRSWGLEVLRVGQDGQISWQGQVSGAEGIATLAPEHRSILNPNVTEIGTSPSDLIDFDHPDFAASILPLRVLEGQNLAVDKAERGGSITVPNAFDIVALRLRELLKEVISEDPTGNAFERKGNNITGTQIDLDLGARIGVNQIRFFPRNTVFPSPTTPFHNDFLQEFELHINDGVVLTEAGNPIWERYFRTSNNTEPITVVPIDPPRYIRFIRLRATSSIPFEIEKLQVFGEGFLPIAQYISPVIDMGTRANWGRLRWVQDLAGNAKKVQIQIRTHSGSDPTPFVYTRKRVGRRDAQEIPLSVEDPSQPLSRTEYLNLRAKGEPNDTWERGSVKEDLDHWSPWTSPYAVDEGTSAEGTPVLSPGPRRYFQFRVDFLSEELESSFILRQFSFEFTTPALADALTAEIFPREVSANTDIPFVFAVRAEMASEDLQGFDGFELVTGRRVRRIERIEIIDAEGQHVVDHTFAVQDGITEEGEVAINSITEEGFAVRFPPIQDHDTLLKVHFVDRVLTYSSAFEGRALLGEDAFQGVVPGDATILDENDISFKSGITVLSPSITRAELVGNFALGARVFTPNGDGVNDRLELSYDILAVVGRARITLEIFDLTGRLVRRLFDREGQNGVYDPSRFAELSWDGTDQQGEQVAPGLYLIQLKVDGDARSSAAVRTVGLVY